MEKEEGQTNSCAKHLRYIADIVYVKAGEYGRPTIDDKLEQYIVAGASAT